jgi:hypothetical protein
MDIYNFDYVDAKNKASTRKVLVTGLPNDKIHGIEVRETDEVELFELCKEFKQLKKEYDEKLAAILAKHDLTYNRRMFFPDKISNLKVEKTL